MFVNFFHELKNANLPVSLREYLTLLEAMDKGIPNRKIEEFYYLSRSTLVKDEKNLDKFDQVFGHVFKGLESLESDEIAEIPEEWLKTLNEKFLTEEEKQKIESMGGWDKLMEELKKRLEEQDKREFKNLDKDVEIGTRNIKVALRRLRKFARDGAADTLDLPGTIKNTADKGYLDISLVPERRNKVKVLLFFDIGGSMDMHVKLCEELFSAAKTEFKNMESFYFHNCLYESVWKDNRRRHTEKIDTWDILHKYSSDYKVIFVGDASMSPYEITYPGGSVEHWNEEAGAEWLQRITDIYQNVIWINPVETKHWEFTPSTQIISQIISDRMYPLTLDGLDKGMKELSRNK
jgi:uncharacterized protein with von Willebrand factor type A (vWA) domain